jgi:hypothetical protein
MTYQTRKKKPGDKDPESNHELRKNDKKHTKTNLIEIGNSTEEREATPPLL